MTGIAAAVLSALASLDRPATAKEIAEVREAAPQTVTMSLTALVRQGHVRRIPGKPVRFERAEEIK